MISNRSIRYIDGTQILLSPVRIHRLQLCRGVKPLANECPVYDSKQSDGEIPVMLELWGMRSTPLLALIPGPL